MEVSDEMGGRVALGQARMLCRILDIPQDGLTGMRENYIEGPNETIHMGVTKCVDLSDVLEACESFEVDK